ETVGEKSGLFEDTVWSFRCLKESDVVDLYKKQPHEIDMKPTNVVDQSGALRNFCVQVNPDQPHTIVNIYRRRELNHSMLMQAVVENRGTDLEALFHAPSHNDMLGKVQDKATVELIEARNEAASEPKESHEIATGPPASKPVETNASSLSQLEGASPGGASSLLQSAASAAGGGSKVTSGEEGSNWDSGEGTEESEEAAEETRATRAGWSKLRCRVAGDQKAKTIKTMSGSELAQRTDRDVPKVPAVFQRALWERALEDWKADQDWASKPGVAISMCLPWAREVGNVGNVVKFECKSPTLALMRLPVAEKASIFKDYLCKIILPRFLNLGKGGHQKTIELAAAEMGEIRAMPVTCELEVDNAAAEVVAMLQLMNTLRGQAEDTLHPAAVEQLGKAKATTIEGAVYAVVPGESYWEVKRWRPTMARQPAALQSHGSTTKDLPVIKAALPEVEYGSFFQMPRGALGRFFEHLAAHVKNSPHEATDEFSDNVGALSQKAYAIFGVIPVRNDAVASISSLRSQNNGKNLVEHFCTKLEVFNLDMLVFAVAQFDKIDGLKDLAPVPSMRKFISFTKPAVELVTKTRSTTLDVYCDPFFDASLRWMSKASAWLQWSCVSPAGSGFKSFEQLIERAKLAKAVLRAMATIVPTDPNIGFSDEDAAAAPDHSVDASLSLLTQYEAVQEGDPQNEADTVKDTFMKQLTPETEALKQKLFGAKRAALKVKLLTENESVPLGKLKGGLLDRDWRDGISPSIAFDGLLECAHDFLKNLPHDLLKAEVDSSMQLKNDLETLTSKFNITVQSSPALTEALANLQRAATTVLESAVVYG
ncbi:unnamed protein product, partial [Prorocentrum cordatum]